MAALSDRTGFRFSAEYRLKKSADFQRVYNRRRSVSNEFLILYGAENDLCHPRLGLSLSRKVGSAVYRNRLKRLYREAFRLAVAQMPLSLDLILISRGKTEPKLEELKTAMPTLAGELAGRLAKETPK